MADPSTHPTFLEFLVAEYAAAMNRENVNLKAKHQGAEGTAPEIDVTHHVSVLDAFRRFAADYLNFARPANLEHADGNYLIQLTNQQRFFISPPLTQHQGQMQPANAVPVTGRSQMGGTDFGDGIPITNPDAARPVSGPHTDMTQSVGVQNMVLPDPGKRYDK